MRIRRQVSRQGRRRTFGLFSPVLLLGMLLGGLAVASWNWLGQWWPGNAPAWTRAGSLRAAQESFDQGELDTAIARSREWLAAAPQDPRAILLLARALIYRSYHDYDRGGDRQEALQLTEETLAAAGTSASADLRAMHAFALQAAGRTQAARETAVRALGQEPQHALARVSLALAYSDAGNHAQSLRHSRLAVEAPGWRMDSLRALAIGYSGVGEFARAAESAERALRLNPRLIALLFERALYARQLGDADAASVAWFRILARDPENAKARLRLCELSGILREPATALDWCLQVVARAPSWAAGWYGLGYEQFLQGDFRAAQTSLQHCATLQLQQGVPPARRHFACWYLQGQAAELNGDCAALLRIWNEYRSMARVTALPQFWVYPPEGPPSCATPAAA